MNESKLCAECNRELDEEKTELELINELQDAITESLRKNSESQFTKEDEENMSCMSVDSQQLNGELRQTNLDLWSPNVINDITEELANDYTTLKRTLSKSDLIESVPKRQKLCGPKSRMKALQRIRRKQIVFYEPLSLTLCILNSINKENVPDFYSENSNRIVQELDELEVVCFYCDRTFSDMNSLAIHEGKHLQIKLHDKVDFPAYWNPSRENAYIRNKWLKDELESENSQDDECEEELLVPIITTGNEIEMEEEEPTYETEEHPDDNPPVSGDIVLINTKPTVNGIPLSEIPKDDRRYLFKTILIAGVRRKFCPLCRFTFKDNWAIELHYFSSACYFTCRYCGVRFNKQRSIYDEHVQEHINNGHPISSKIFASRKKNDPVPKVIHETRIKTVASVLRKIPKVKPIKMKKLLLKRGFSNSPTIKREGDLEDGFEEPRSVIPNDRNVQSKAYFCRKCYKVFFKLGEFNEHSNNCNVQLTGPIPLPVPVTPPVTNGCPPTDTSTPISSKSNSESESYTSSGRPLRNCVKEVSYNDEIYEVGQTSGSNSPVLAFECNYCNCTFPTFQSRNSHMRIHKNRMAFNSNGEINPSITIRPNNMNQIIPTNISNLYPQVSIKEEPVDDEEEEEIPNMPTSIGDVSITPISNSNKKINPDIMKLVHGNPNLTIKNLGEPGKSRQAANNAAFDESRLYRCSSCSKPFTNKSTLYFHKKNQCGGSKYPCPFCKKRFGTEAAYSSHIFYSHPE